MSPLSAKRAGGRAASVHRVVSSSTKGQAPDAAQPPATTPGPGRSRLTPRRMALTLAALLALLVLVCLLSLMLGVQRVSLGAVLSPGTLDHTIVFGVRLPRLFLGLLVGGALGGAGATLQAVLRNPLADPFVLGVSGGAALGATLALLASTLLFAGAGAELASTAGASAPSFGAWALAVPASLAAALGALCTTGLMFWIARTGGRLDPHSLLLAGVVFNAFATAVILFLRTLVTPDEAQMLLPWLVGSVSYRPWPALMLGAVMVAAGCAYLCAGAHRLNLLSMGEESAATLGVDVDKTRVLLVLTVSLLVGATVSLAGLVGFVGLVVPHMLRLILGPDNRLLVPASILGGSIFLCACDLAARLAFLSVGTEPPVGAVTALIGAPLFLVLLRRGAARRSA